MEIGEVALPGVSLVGLRQEAGNTVHYVPSGELRALQCFEYDVYTDSSHVFVSVPGYVSGYYGHVGGKRTGLRKRSLSDGRWYRETYYYDEHGRELQRIYDNALGGVSRVDRSYDFTGNVVKERESHGMADGRMDVLESDCTYDRRSRLLERSASLNGGKPVVIRNGYDEVGRETARLYGDYAVAYRYNVRSWQTLSVSRDFHESLFYESGVGGHPGRYNGSISGVEWRNGGDAISLYLPEYDGFDRLSGVEEYRQTASGWEKNPAGYEERGIVYDRNGNIKSLQRTVGGKVVDDLAYTYTGNRLTKLSERERAETAGDVYAPGASEDGMYEYDLNGNLKKDSRRGLEYDYNSLNLLSEVRRDGQPAVKYDWLADDTKLGVRDVGGENGFVYAGSLIYRTEGKALKLETAHFGDGVIRVNENGTQAVDYFICDHLGSVRMIVDSAGAVKERNDYYPFGARHVRSDYALSTNRWKYNGKELQVTGDLGFLDYGARMYDMSVGRWFGMDPLTEEYMGLSGYAYAGNNPFSYIDVLGMFLGEPLYYGGMLDEAIVRPPRYTWNTSDIQSALAFFRTSAGIWTSDYNRRYNWSRMPDYSNLNITLSNDYSNPFSPILHDLLDMGGMLPGIGEPLDLINAGVYLLEGDKLNFSLSMAAVIPVAGNFATGTRMVGKTTGKAYKYTVNNFRKNLIRLTSLDPGKAYQAHHIFPKKFEKYFNQVGINIHDSKYGAWWETKTHGKKSYEYNQEWMKILRGKPTIDDIMNKARELAKEYGYKLNF